MISLPIDIGILGGQNYGGGKVSAPGFAQLHRKSAAGISTGGEKSYLIEGKTDRLGR
jgi:hypothetical protein